MKRIRIFEDEPLPRQRIEKRLQSNIPQELLGAIEIIPMKGSQNWWNEIEDLVYGQIVSPETRSNSEEKPNDLNEYWLVDLNLNLLNEEAKRTLMRYYASARKNDEQLNLLLSNALSENTVLIAQETGIAILIYAKLAGIPARVVSQAGNYNVHEFKLLLSYLVTGKSKSYDINLWGFKKELLAYNKKNHNGEVVDQADVELGLFWKWIQNNGVLPEEDLNEGTPSWLKGILRHPNFNTWLVGFVSAVFAIVLFILGQN